MSCTYSTAPDGDFVLERRGPLVVGAGFAGHGFKHAPAVGEVLADLVTDQTPVMATGATPGGHPRPGGIPQSRP